MAAARQIRFTGRQPLWQVGRVLTEVCMGRRFADRIVRGGRLVNVHTREILSADVAISNGRVACVGDVAGTLGPDTEVLDAAGAYLVPGLVDAHVHVESTLVTVRPFAKAVLRAGTTTVLIENHDTANVLGADGIRWMLKESSGLPLKVLLAVPSCVPPLPALEDSGARLTPHDVESLLDEAGVAGLGEVMNMQAVLDGDPDLHAVIAAALQRGMVATGHWSLSGWNDHRLQAYAACGVDSCHESLNPTDAVAKLRAGMWVQFREGSAFHDMAALAPLLASSEVDTRHVMFITDDVAPDFLLEEGHLDNAVRVAVAHGVDPLTAIQAATLAPAEYLGLRHDIGSIAPGRFADILFVEDLHDLRPHRVLADGADVAMAGDEESDPSRYAYPPAARQSVVIPQDLSVADFRISAPGPRVTVRAIGMVDRVVPTEHLLVETFVDDGQVPASIDLDLAKVALVNRYGGPKQVALGFVHGLALAGGAIAQSTARDTHHLLVVGMNDADMMAAVRVVGSMGGGMAVVRDGEVLAQLSLPIAGLVSEASVEHMADELRHVVKAIRELGCVLEQPTTMLAMLAVSAIPELRIGNRGLIDARDYRIVEAVVS